MFIMTSLVYRDVAYTLTRLHEGGVKFIYTAKVCKGHATILWQTLYTEGVHDCSTTQTYFPTKGLVNVE